jgi:hypothetical protein
VAGAAPAIVEAPAGEAPRQKERSVRAASKRPPRVAASRVAAPPVVEETFDDLAPELPLDTGDADPPARPPRGGTRASEMPSVQVRGIAYDSDSAARTVTLRVAGGRAVTLHEGQSASGVNVQLIMPNVVYLRHGGDIFALSP